MGWPGTKTQTAGTKILSSDWNNYVNPALQAVAHAGTNPAPYCRLYATNGAVSVPNNAETVLTLYEGYDVGNMFSGGTRITIPTGWGGMYWIGAKATFVNAASGQRIAIIRRNGSTLMWSHRPSAGASYFTEININTQLYPLAAGDYLELVAFQDSGSALNLTPWFDATHVWVAWAGVLS